MLSLRRIDRRGMALASAIATLSLLIAVAPVSIKLPQIDLQPQAALAKPGGNGNGNAGGNGNGNAGGNGNGNAGGNGSDHAGMGGKDSKGARGKSGSAPGRADKTARGRAGDTNAGSKGMGLALGHSKDSVSGLAVGKSKSHEGQKDQKDRGISASALGSLNAAHASETARANAAPNSRVGRLASYEESLADYEDSMHDSDLQAAAESLAAAANKSIDSDVVSAVNDLLGIEVDPALESDLESEIAERAEAARTGEDSSEEN